MLRCVLRHSLVSLFIREESIEVLSNSRRISRLDKKAGLLVLHLQRDAASRSRDDRDALVKRLANFDLEAFPSGELECDTGIG